MQLHFMVGSPHYLLAQQQLYGFISLQIRGIRSMLKLLMRQEYRLGLLTHQVQIYGQQ